MADPIVSIKTCSRCRQAKPLEEFSRRNGRAGGRQSNCKVCSKEARQEWLRDRPDYMKQYAARNPTTPEQRAKNRRRFAEKHPERLKQFARAQYLRQRAYYKAKALRWFKANATRDSARVSARRARKIGATPDWANAFFIEEAYDIARTRTRVTGVQWHVDHIVPLVSDLVCGLHVENNLAVIPASHNIAKGNRHWPDMP